MITYLLIKEFFSIYRVEPYTILVAVFLSILSLPVDMLISSIELLSLIIYGNYRIIKNRKNKGKGNKYGI